MQEPDVPAALKNVTGCGQAFRMMDTSFFLARQTLLPSAKPGMPLWREKIFAWMLRNAESAMEFFRLPTNRVVELGSQVEICPTQKGEAAHPRPILGTEQTRVGKECVITLR